MKQNDTKTAERFPPTERHPLEPFLPPHARILFLGSFPPKRERWSMDFFYPNFTNDMWRIMGTVFFGNRHFFEKEGERRFDRDAIIRFCTTEGIALYDSATEVRRLKDNASDKFLEIVSPTDIHAMLASIPECRAIVTTGKKASEAVAAQLGCGIPPTGGCVSAAAQARTLRFYRMPSSSRAYPLALDKKAEAYGKMFLSEGFRIWTPQ